MSTAFEPSSMDCVSANILSLSTGISVYPDDSDDVDALMRYADAAMLHAKASGDNSYRFFTAEMPGRAIAMRTTCASAAR